MSYSSKRRQSCPYPIASGTGWLACHILAGMYFSCCPWCCSVSTHHGEMAGWTILVGIMVIYTASRCSCRRIKSSTPPARPRARPSLLSDLKSSSDVVASFCFCTHFTLVYFHVLAASSSQKSHIYKEAGWREAKPSLLNFECRRSQYEKKILNQKVIKSKQEWWWWRNAKCKERKRKFVFELLRFSYMRKIGL